MLGQRTVRVVLNEPYTFRSPQAILDAGDEKRHHAIRDAKTQHKQKTVDQIKALAETTRDKFAESGEDTTLEKLRKDAEYDRDVLKESLQNEVKGIGHTGVNIFLRRIQGLWEECFPFVDDRTKRSLEKYGLPSGQDDLKDAMEKHWH